MSSVEVKIDGTTVLTKTTVALTGILSDATTDLASATIQFNSMKIMDFDSDATGTSYRPLITTYSSAYTNRKPALRLTYPLSSPATVGEGAELATGAFTAAWESIAVPAGMNPSATATFTELNNAATRPVIGYNGSYMEQAELLEFLATDITP